MLCELILHVKRHMLLTSTVVHYLLIHLPLHQILKEYIINLFKVIVINIIIGVTISNIDNSAHIGGLIFGMISALILKNKKIY